MADDDATTVEGAPQPENSCTGCGRPAKMACPHCVKIQSSQPPGFRSDYRVAYYCAQDCFKKHWKGHKAQHKPWAAAVEIATPLGKGAERMPPCFDNYDAWTGSLRPWARPSVDNTRARLARLPSCVQKPDYAGNGQPYSEQLDKQNRTAKVYTPEQINGIREACRIGREVLDAAGNAVKGGVTTAELDRVTYEATVSRGAYPSPLNYHNFPCAVCTSVNEVICHGIPDLRPLKDGDVVNVDVSVFYKGYHGDLNETFVVGNSSQQDVGLVETAFRCLEAGAALIRPGTMYRDLGSQIERVAKKRGCQVVKTYCGHGIGELFHTAPNVPHYNKNKAVGVMQAGHIFTIEPMVNLGGWRDKTWPDDWTAVTADGSKSAQFEHTFLVTADGYEILTQRKDEPRMAWDLAKQQR